MSYVLHLVLKVWNQGITQPWRSSGEISLCRHGSFFIVVHIWHSTASWPKGFLCLKSIRGVELFLSSNSRGSGQTFKPIFYGQAGMQKAADISDLFFLSWCWFWNYANMHQCYQHHGTKGLKNRVDRNPGKPLLSQLDCSLNSLIAWQTYNLLKSDFSNSP